MNELPHSELAPPSTSSPDSSERAPLTSEAKWIDAAIGRALFPVEAAAGVVWSLAELARIAAHPEEVISDPYRETVLEDIDRRGFYADVSDRLALRMHRGGWISAPNPYERVGEPRRDRVVAHFRPAPARTKRLLVVCHCYGIQSPRLMDGLFGASALDADVVTNIACHHEKGGFDLWPGSGFLTLRTSRFIENVRASALGLRALTRTLVATRRYEQVSVVGFSLGGQLALHLANSHEIDGALLYCPAINVRAVATELGLMRVFGARAIKTLEAAGLGHRFDDLGVAEPLSYPLTMAQEKLHVVVQRLDLMATPRGIEPIRARYPRSSWLELPGTHLFPVGQRALKARVRALFE
jgi:dienelactone hydrolase